MNFEADKMAWPVPQGNFLSFGHENPFGRASNSWNTNSTWIFPIYFLEILNRFYTIATDVLTKNDAWIDKFVGDEAIGLFIPGFAGDNHPSLAIKSAVELLEATGHASSEGPWAPLGIGINTGNVFMGAVGSGSVTDITPLGDNVNIAARLSSESKTGEILISEASYNSPDCKKNSSQKIFKNLEMKERILKLKGKKDGQKVYIGCMRAKRWFPDMSLLFKYLSAAAR